MAIWQASTSFFWNEKIKFWHILQWCDNSKEIILLILVRFPRAFWFSEHLKIFNLQVKKSKFSRILIQVHDIGICKLKVVDSFEILAFLLSASKTNVFSCIRLSFILALLLFSIKGLVDYKRVKKEMKKKNVRYRWLQHTTCKTSVLILLHLIWNMTSISKYGTTY